MNSKVIFMIAVLFGGAFAQNAFAGCESAALNYAKAQAAYMANPTPENYNAMVAAQIALTKCQNQPVPGGN
jgi:hypothetical protein